jgi:hypothetical protein
MIRTWGVTWRIVLALRILFGRFLHHLLLLLLLIPLVLLFLIVRVRFSR